MNEIQERKVNMMASMLQMLEGTAESMMGGHFPRHNELQTVLTQVHSLMHASKAFYDALAKHYGKESPADAGMLAAMSDELSFGIEQFLHAADERGFNLTDR